MKLSVESVDPMLFVAARFTVGTLALAPLAWRQLRVATRALWLTGAWLGLALGAGFVLQTYGLRESTPARAAFITGLNVVIVPILASALFRQPPGRLAIAGVALAFLGMAVLTAPDDLGAGMLPGDLLVLGCAVAFAAHIVGVGRHGARYDARAVTTVQVATVAAGTAVLATLGDSDVRPLIDTAWGVVYMGVLGTGLVFLLQNWAQKHTSATHTALIFALEPVFAALFSALLYGEVLTGRMAVGGALIVAGIVIAEFRARTPPTAG